MKELTTVVVLFVSVIGAYSSIASDAVDAQTSSTVVSNEVSRRVTSGQVFKKVKDQLVIVQCDTSTGSGFLAEMEDGRVYFVTNKHVVDCQRRVAAFLVSGKKGGKELSLGEFQYVEDRDLVRFLVLDRVKGLPIVSDDAVLGEPIFVFGNSDGAMVATDLSGTILGIGPSEIEVSAKFVRGNSGSAVLNQKGEVVAVATYATQASSPEDWTKSDTRFNEVRRFAIRLTGVEWKSVKYSDYYNKCIARKRKEYEENQILPEVTAQFRSPSLYHTSLRDGIYIKSDICLSMKSKNKTIKTPIIRVAILLKGQDGIVYMEDRILKGVGSMRTLPCPPVYSYGERSSNRRYLELVSYYQPQYNDQFPRISVKFFNKGSAYEHLFWFPHGIAGSNVRSNILCFRFECWQNGSLAGSYDSRTPAQLNAKDIPVDWFVFGKYPTRFKYRVND